MPATGSVSQWITQLKAGDHAAAQPLWESYFRQLVQHARQKLAGAPRRAADEEDVALSAFDSFCRAAQQNRFPRLDDRHDLWRLLIVIADRKAVNLMLHERRQKRGGGKVLDEAALRTAGSAAEGAPLAGILSQEPSPDLVAQVAEEYRRLFERLGDGDLQRVVVLKMEGYTIEEIATQMGWVAQTVRRRLRLIRRIWEQEIQS